MDALDFLSPEIVDAAARDSAPKPAAPAATVDPVVSMAASGAVIPDSQRAAGDVASVQKEIARAQSARYISPQAKQNQLDILNSELTKAQARVASAPDDMPYLSADTVHKAALAVPQAQALQARPQALTAPDLSGVPGQLRSVLTNQVTSIGANIVGGYRGLSTLLSGGTMDDAANNTRDYVESHTYTPPAGTPAAQGVASFNSPNNPQNWPSRALDAAGGAVTDATGSPALGAIVNGGGMAALATLGMRGKPATAPVEVGPTRPAVGAYRSLFENNPTASAFAPRVPEPPVPAAAGAAPGARPPAPGAAAEVPAARAAPVEAQPVPTTPEAVQAVAERAPAALFPETPTTAPAGQFSAAEQAARAKILDSVGIETARKSAITGDGTGGSTDFQTAKLDSPAGRQMKAVIEGEKNALVNHADSLVADTGGTHGVDQSALYARGNTIVAPLDALKQWFDTKTSALYKAADERAQGVPTTLSNFASTLGDASELTNSDRVHLQSAVNAYVKKLGMAGEDGSIAGSAQQAETIRKYLNEQWSPQNSKMVGKLKDALDTDVTSSAGEDIYSQARQIRALRGQTLDNPNGIAKLMDSSGPEGVNRAVPVEKIADSLTGMPVDQFSHVIKTLREAPDELQPQSQAALAEIKAQFANKVQAVGSAQQGQWNAKGVTKYLQNNAARMAQVFSPEEIAKFRNLNDAGHIVAKDQSYPGAAVQGHNLITQGIMGTMPGAGAAAGGFVGGPAGAWIGSVAGRAVAGAMDNAATMRAVNKRTVPLSSILGGSRRAPAVAQPSPVDPVPSE